MLQVFDRLTSDQAQQWNNFIANNTNSGITQSPAWADFQSSLPGRQVLFFESRDNTNTLIATCLCIYMPTGHGGLFWYYAPRGPIISDISQANDFLKDISTYLQSHTKALFVRFDPAWSADKYNHIQLQTYSEAKSYQPTDTLVLDLTLTEPELLAQMKRKGRYNISLAQKNDVTCQTIPGDKITHQDIDDFYSLLQQTTQRDGFAGHSKSYYQSFVKKLQSKSYIVFSIYQGRRIAVALCTHYGHTATYYYGASTSDPQHRKLMAPYLTQWHAILHARSLGALSYDFLGIAPEKQPYHQYTAISQFKNKFGGTRKTVLNGREIPLRNMFYWIYRITKKITGA